MALCTQIYHVDGSEGLPKDASGGSVGWSMWHCMRIADAMIEDMGDEWHDDMSRFPDEYTFKHDYVFVAPETDIWGRGGEPNINYTLTISAGDIYRCWRDR